MRILKVIILLVFRDIILGQTPIGLYDLIIESEFIIIGEVNSIDTLKPEKFEYFENKNNSAVIQIDKTLKGKIKEEYINLKYQVTGGSHIYPANLKLKNRYIIFMNFETDKGWYYLPLNRFSIDTISSINEKIVIDIIEQINQNIEIDLCKYFELILSNLDKPIFQIKWTLYDLSLYQDSIQNELCIDSTDLKKMFNSFKKTRNVDILPFIREYNYKVVDNILIDEIILNLKIMSELKEMYYLEEGGKVISCLRHLSFNKYDDQILKDIKSLYDHIWMGEHEIFLKKSGEYFVIK